MVSKAAKFKEATPELADLWFETYKRALNDGFIGRPTGPLTDDLRCRAAASLTGGTKIRWRGGRGRWPTIYGGNVDTRSVNNQWSASRFAAMAVFERALQLGLEPAEAGRSVRAAKMLTRARLKIVVDDKVSIETWLSLSDDERNKRGLLLKRMNYKHWYYYASYRNFDDYSLANLIGMASI